MRAFHLQPHGLTELVWHVAGASDGAQGVASMFLCDQTCAPHICSPIGAKISTVSASDAFNTASFAFNFNASYRTPRASLTMIRPPSVSDKTCRHAWILRCKVYASSRACSAGSPLRTCNLSRSASFHVSCQYATTRHLAASLTLATATWMVAPPPVRDPSNVKTVA